MQLKRNKEMEFETLKKNYKKQIIVGALVICVIGGVLTYTTSRAFYKVDGRIDLAKGIVNYKPYDFKIMAMYQSEDGSNYTEITDRMPSSGYIINESKSYCIIDNKTHDANVRLYTNSSGEHIFSNLAKSDKCYLYFDKYVPPIPASTIVANIISIAKITSPDFSQRATTDEGIYAVSDGMYGGTSYYWRGAATTNHVIFANKCWRIVRINGDKTMRLIYNGTVQSGNTCTGNGSNSGSIAVTSQAYNSNSDRSEYVGWTYSTGSQRTASGTASDAKSQTETWYSNNITGTNVNKLADGKFCNDRNTASGYSWSSQPTSTFYYAAYDRSGAKSSSSVNPTLGCPTGDVYALKVGAITMDEVVMAGGIFDYPNSSYYLYNGQNYWTMSPSHWAYGSSSERYAIVFYVYKIGYLNNVTVDWTEPGLRPVINLRSDVIFNSGDGTQNNPYVVE